MMGPLMLDPELTYFLLDCFPSIHTCATPDTESHVRQIECHVFTWQSSPVKLTRVFLMQRSILPFAVLNRAISLGAEGVDREISHHLCKGPAGIVKPQSVVMILISQVQKFILHVNHYLRQTLAASNSCIDVVRVTGSVLVCCGKVSIKKEKIYYLTSANYANEHIITKY